MRAKDKTEDVLKSIHVLFSKAEPIEGSKKKVIIDRERMMKLLKDLNNCMYAMMDEYEMTSQSKERALRDIQKKSDEIIFDSRKNAEDIYAASIMYTDHALDEIQKLIDQTKAEVSSIHEAMQTKMDESRQVLKDNQIELKNNLSTLIDREKYLKLIEAENKRLQREAEKRAENPEWNDTPEKVVAEIKINEDYFRAKGLIVDDIDDSEEADGEKPAESEAQGEEEVIDESLLAELDSEYFEWKDNKETNGSDEESDDTEDAGNKKRGLFGFGRKKE